MSLFGLFVICLFWILAVIVVPVALFFAIRALIRYYARQNNPQGETPKKE